MKKLYLIILFIICLIIFGGKVYALEDGVYIIHSAIDNNYVLDIDWGNASNGTNIQLWKNSNSISQKFKIKNTNDGYYEISSVINESYKIDVNGATFNNSTNIQLWQKNNGIAQKWKIKEENGYYRLYSYDENYVLDACGAIASNGTNIQLWKSNSSNAQKYRFELITDVEKTIENGLYTISSGLNNNMAIDIYGGNYKNSTNIQLWQRHNGLAQQFYVTYLGEGLYSIKSYANINYALDVAWGSTRNEANVELYKYGGSKNQQWIIKDVGSGYYNIISKCNYLALDVYGGYSNNGTNIQMYKLHNSNGQKFKFNKIENNTKTLDNGYYFINSALSSRKTMDINYGVMENNRNIELYNLNYGTNQKWYLEYLNNGYYKISSNRDDNYCMQLSESNVNIGECNGNDNQQWSIKAADNGYYILSKAGKYIDVYGGNTTNNTNIQVYTFNGGNGQKFKFNKTASGISKKIIADGIYRISSALDKNMFLDVNGASNLNYTNIQLWYGNASKAQKFKINYMSNGYYKIIPLVDLTKSIDVAGGSIKNGTNLYIYDNYEILGQQWIIKDTDDGYYNIISNSGGNYIDVANGSANNGTNVLMWYGNGGKNQKFKFIPAMETTKVIDVSAHQGKIDWNKVYNTGIYGVILRIGTWETLDSRFYSYLDEVERLGLPYGIYLYSYASTTNGANIEANFTKNIINGTLKGHEGRRLNPILGIYYDIEDWYISEYNTSNILSKNDYDNLISTYINNVSSSISNKYKVKVYANSNYALNRFNDYARNQVDWLADYRGYKGYKRAYIFMAIYIISNTQWYKWLCGYELFAVII